MIQAAALLLLSLAWVAIFVWHVKLARDAMVEERRREEEIEELERIYEKASR